MIVAGLLVIAIGGLIGAWLFSQGGKSLTAVATRTQILAGQQITEQQLTTVQLPLGTGLNVVPGEKLRDLIGKYATSTIPAGSTLTPDVAQSVLEPSAAHSVIGIGLKPTQMPARGLRGGDPVRIVVTASANGTVPGDATKPGTAWSGRVVSSGAAGANGVVTVDVEVTAVDAPTIAAAAGAGNVAAIVDSNAS
jgi:hypothetical protein